MNKCGCETRNYTENPGTLPQTLPIIIQRLAFLALVLISVPLAANASIEASGIVTRVIDGDTIEVQGFGQVSLADVKCPGWGPSKASTPESMPWRTCLMFKFSG